MFFLRNKTVCIVKAYADFTPFYEVLVNSVTTLHIPSQLSSSETEKSYFYPFYCYTLKNTQGILDIKMTQTICKYDN